MHPFVSLKFSLITAILILSPAFLVAQAISGVVVDSLSGEPLLYVQIGVPGKNVGTISHDLGNFEVDLAEVGADELVHFSLLGYERKAIAKNQLLAGDTKIVLSPEVYQAVEVVVRAKQLEEIQLGNARLSKTTTGQSGIEEFGFGGEWGVKVVYPGRPYTLRDVRFHTKYNTVDSALYRVNVYGLTAAGLPGETKLEEQVFVTSHAKDKWITASLLAQDIVVASNIVATVELVRIWYAKKGSNNLFYTHARSDVPGAYYSRASSFDAWTAGGAPPFALYVTGFAEAGE